MESGFYAFLFVSRDADRSNPEHVNEQLRKTLEEEASKTFALYHVMAEMDQPPQSVFFAFLLFTLVFIICVCSPEMVIVHAETLLD